MSAFKFFRNNDNYVNLNLVTVNVDTAVRRLRAIWTPEISQDLQYFAGIVNLVNELSTILSQQISEEIDREIFNSIAFPMARRVFGITIEQDLVSVQPLNEPVGQLHYLDFKIKISLLETFKYFK